MSSNIQTVLVKSDVLAGLSDTAIFAVKKGAQSASIVKFTPNSISPSTQTYTIQVPSLSTVMGREVLWNCRKTYTITGSPVNGTFLVNMGQDAPAAFCNHADVINMQVLINNTSVSMATQQTLDALLHATDKEKLAKWSAFAPAMLDSYANYQDILGAGVGAYAREASNNPLAGFEKAYLGDVLPRGCYIESITGNTVGTYLPGVGPVYDNPVAGDLRTVKITVVSTEPLMIPPFTWGDEENQSQGIYGISNIQFTANCDPTGARGFRFANNNELTEGVLAKVNKKVVGVEYVDNGTFLEVRYYTPHPSDLLSEVNVVPCPTFQNYRTQQNINVPFSPTGATFGTPILSNNLQLNSIADKVFIWIKPTDSALGSGADACLAIKAVRINFANQTNLLGSASQSALWRLSREAGSNQSFLEFKGLSPVVWNVNTETLKNVSTKGSILMLNMEDIGIMEDYYCPGSVGQFNFSVEVDYSNTTGKDLTIVELNVCFMNSGLFITQNGTSSLYSSGLISKQQCLDASLTESIPKSQLKRMVGGSFLSSLGSIASKALPYIAPLAKNVLSNVSNPLGPAAAAALGALGYGKGGAISGGTGMTGGRMKNRLL